MTQRLLALCTLLVCALTSLTAQTLKIDPSKIDIVRDSFGVAHIFAKTDPEVAYGLAWATAEDDMENAQFMLLAIRGKLGKHLGVDGAKVDFAVQMMRINEHVAAHYETDISDDFKRVLEGYCMGVNAYAAQHPEEVWVKGVFPVKPQDMIVGYMLGQALMEGVDGAIKSMVDGTVSKRVPKDVAIGSNAYALNSNKTTTGETFLCVNPHQPVEGLLSWYEAHVCSEEGWNIAGAMFHGSAIIFVGTNENLGWSHTTGQLDGKDLYQLEMHPKKSKKLYRFDGEWLKLEKYHAKMKVKVGKKGIIKIPVQKKYWSSIYGPTMISKQGVFALRMPALMSITPAEQWYRMNKATNFTEFYKALEMQGHSRQNITYADRYDTIMVIANGLMPVRDPHYDWTKVVPGDTSATLWTEYYPEKSLAQFINPACGYVFNANNSAFVGSCPETDLNPSDFPATIGYTTEETNRSRRSREILENSGKMSFEDFRNLKYDITYPKDMLFVRDFPIDELFTMKPADYPEIADALQRIQAFDRTADKQDRNFPILLYTLYSMYHHCGGKMDSLRNSADYRVKFFEKEIANAQQTMLKHFGTIDVPVEQVQIIERNGVEYGVSGGPDLIRAIYGDEMSNGKLRTRVGDSYVQLVRFPKDGLPVIESISTYGASSKPDSEHYTDQMQLYADHKMKLMPLDKETVYKNAVKVYHPQ